MNTMNTENSPRPFGYWLKAVDRLMAAEFATAFEAEGISRREWRLLNVVDGTAASDRPLREHKLHRLIELGWVADADDTWTLTEDGQAAKERLGGIVDGIRARVSDAVPQEDLATTLASLEQIARAFGWEEGTRLPRSRRHHQGHRGFGGPRGFGRGHFGHGHPGHGHPGHGHPGHGHPGHGHPGHRGFRDGGFDPGHSQHPDAHNHSGHSDHRGHRDHDHRGHGRGHLTRFAQGAYERGFDAGFTRGHDA